MPLLGSFRLSVPRVCFPALRLYSLINEPKSQIPLIDSYISNACAPHSLRTPVTRHTAHHQHTRIAAAHATRGAGPGARARQHPPRPPRPPILQTKKFCKLTRPRYGFSGRGSAIAAPSAPPARCRWASWAALALAALARARASARYPPGAQGTPRGDALYAHGLQEGRSRLSALAGPVRALALLMRGRGKPRVGAFACRAVVAMSAANGSPCQLSQSTHFGLRGKHGGKGKP